MLGIASRETWVYSELFFSELFVRIVTKILALSSFWRQKKDSETSVKHLKILSQVRAKLQRQCFLQSSTPVTAQQSAEIKTFPVLSFWWWKRDAARRGRESRERGAGRERELMKETSTWLTFWPDRLRNLWYDDILQPMLNFSFCLPIIHPDTGRTVTNTLVCWAKLVLTFLYIHLSYSKIKCNFSNFSPYIPMDSLKCKVTIYKKMSSK